ncbi:hypothetical protein M5K25_015526 [Dendrobium thyrsiflorum]|uniref:Uncharacterized protein n=1 Tax=Dendrobium thyrsiflorum TaxID=117978 RepID=A0ABD0UXM2_DENTH
MFLVGGGILLHLHNLLFEIRFQFACANEAAVLLGSQDCSNQKFSNLLLKLLIKLHVIINVIMIKLHV